MAFALVVSRFSLLVLFSNHLPSRPETVQQVDLLPQHQLNDLFDGTAEATEEAILNALCAAETTTGLYGRTVHALPLHALQRVMG